MSDFAFGLLMLALVVIASGVGARVGGLAFSLRRRPKPTPPPKVGNPARIRELEARLAKPFSEVIAAAEYRAEHPDDPEPDILAELDDRRTTQSLVLAPRIAVHPSGGPDGVLTVPVTPSAEQIKAMLESWKAEHGRYVVVPAHQHVYRKALVSAQQYAAYRAINEARESKAGIRAESRYSTCRHPNAEVEELHGWGSAGPIHTFVKSCRRCDERYEG